MPPPKRAVKFSTRMWESYPEIFLQHIAWGHRLEDKGAFQRNSATGLRIEQEFECECSWGVTRLFTTRFVRLNRQGIYHHPAGYSPCPTIAEARQEWFIRHPPTGAK